MPLTTTFTLTIPPSVWGSADLLRRFKRAAGLAAANEEDDAVDLYPILSSAQNEVVRMIASRFTNAMYHLSKPVTLVPSADRTTFSFGEDAQGNPIVPMGWVQISPNIKAFANNSLFWVDGLDFLDEGVQIRMPNGRAYTGTLYARFVPTPPDISPASPPVLQPADAREMIVQRALIAWAAEGHVRPDLVALAEARWPRAFAEWMLMYRRRFRGGGGLLDPSRWYYGNPDLTG